jgi:hypothetical protein
LRESFLGTTQKRFTQTIDNHNLYEHNVYEHSFIPIGLCLPFNRHGIKLDAAMESRILIRQAQVLVDAARAPLSQSDILIEQNQIVAIAPHLGMRIK